MTIVRIALAGAAIAVAASGCFADGESVAPVLGSADDTAGTAETSGTGSGDEADPDSTSTEEGADSESGPGTTTSPGDTTADPPTCPAMDDCLPPAPAMWDGPHVVVQAPGDGMPPMCPGSSDPLRLGGEPPLDAPPADCECNPGEVDCAVALQAIDSNNADCSSVADFQLLTPGNTDCSDIEIRGEAFGLNGTDGDCPDAEVVATTSEPIWDARYGVCGLNDAVACGDGICAPPGDATRRACVVREGIHECPPGPYQDQVVVFESVDDQRGCGPCVTAPDCGAVDFYDDPSCGGPSFFTWPAAMLGPVCEPSPVAVDADFESVQWSGELGCTVAEAPRPNGDATPADPFTVCCVEP